LSVGNEGVAVSALRPMGTADFQDKMIEVKTNGDYLAPGTRIRITKIITNDILVEPIT
jgi:membrane-bound ClpP family serine protease